MEQIRGLDRLIGDLQGAPPRRLVIAAGHDPHSLRAAARAAAERIAEVTLVGDGGRIASLCGDLGLDADLFTVVQEADDAAAGALAVQMVRQGRADVLMKGLVGTADYMKAILDRDKGLLPPGRLLSHVAVAELPPGRLQPQRLLFLADVAIVPAPDLGAKVQILEYCAAAARAFGCERPLAALIAASENVSPRMPATVEAARIAAMAAAGELAGESAHAVVAGPVSLDLALFPQACRLKGWTSPVGGAADILVFPNIEAGNVFYKSLTNLGGARLAAVVAGASAPCVLTSRADSEETKFLSIALGCRLARMIHEGP